MKTSRTVWKMAGIGVLAVIAGFVVWARRSANLDNQPSFASAPAQTEAAVPAERAEPAALPIAAPKTPLVERSVPISRTLPQAPELPQPEPAWPLEQSVDILLSPQTTYAQRQTIWKRLRDSGQLDEAISNLEERVKNNPQVADYSAVLGTGYLKQAGASKDLRDQAILGMKADQTFDSALATDPNNWEARYMKAVGMSYWPASMNKGTEVLQRFTALIQDQEQQPAQPQFAQSYARLGDEYRKAGQIENAQQVWQRGAALFPNDDDLKRKLASPQ